MNRPDSSTRTEGTDGELLGRFAADGDQAAFAELIARHGPLVLRICRRVCDGDGHAAEDLAQQVFLTLAARAAALKNRRSLAGWLYRASWNVATRYRRDRIARGYHEQAAAASRAAAAAANGGDGGDVPFAVVTSELCDAMTRALSTLPEEYRNALVLHHFAGHTVEQTASVLGVPPGTAASWLSRGRGGLRQQLERQGLVLGTEAVAAWLALEAADASPTCDDESVVEAVSRGVEPRLAAVAAAPTIPGGVGAAIAMTAGGLSRAAMIALTVGILGVAGGGAAATLKAGMLDDVPKPGGTTAGTSSTSTWDADVRPLSARSSGGGIGIGQVPEPGGAIALSVAAAAALLRRRRRKP